MKRVVILFAAVSMLVFNSCKTVDQNVPNDFKVTGTQLRRAVIAGLTRVNPRFYNGWHGDCPGCDVDSETFALLCRENNIQVSLHQNEQASLELIQKACREAWKDMGEDDLFVFYISGHGGQVNDVEGDEDDSKDETLCLWDGSVSDDYLRKLWQEVPRGVRVFFVTDTCNSGTNYKSRSFKRSLPDNFSGSLLHFGGCDDGKSSYGTSSGGVFTTAMVDAWNKDFTYAEWFQAMLAVAPRTQVFVMGQYGASFKDRKVLK